MSRLAWLVPVFVVVAARPALADDKADCDYLEISATSGKAPAIDGELKPLEKKLKRPPFSAWNTFHTLSSGHVALSRDKAEPLRLKQGTASLLLRDRAGKRIELTIEMDDAQGKRMVNAKQAVSAGDWDVFGHNVKDDGHILALTCR